MGVCRDDRAAAPVVGAILIFGFAIILFSLYTAIVIPNENTQVEFDHLQTVENDFVGLRADLLNAKRTGEQRTSVVQLGTQYPSRPLNTNPPDPSGRLATTESGAVTLSGAGTSASELCTGSTGATIETRSLVYTPRYNQLETAESITYEHTVVGRAFRSETLFGTQDLVETNGAGAVTALNLVLLTGEYQAEGVGATSLDITGSGTNAVSGTTGSNTVTLTVPSRFSATQWETQLLEGVQVDATAVGNSRVELEFTTPGSVTLRCSEVAVGESSPSLAYDPGAVAGSGGNSPSQINPGSTGDVKLEDATIQGSGQNEYLDVEFTNLGSEDRNITEARISFYESDKFNQGNNQGAIPDDVEIAADAQALGSQSETIEIGGPFVDTSALDLTIAGSSPGSVALEFDSDISESDWFILTLEFDESERAQYFVRIDS